MTKEQIEKGIELKTEFERLKAIRNNFEYRENPFARYTYDGFCSQNADAKFYSQELFDNLKTEVLKEIDAEIKELEAEFEAL